MQSNHGERRLRTRGQRRGRADISGNAILIPVCRFYGQDRVHLLLRNTNCVWLGPGHCMHFASDLLGTIAILLSRFESGRFFDSKFLRARGGDELAELQVCVVDQALLHCLQRLVRLACRVCVCVRARARVCVCVRVCAVALEYEKPKASRCKSMGLMPRTRPSLSDQHAATAASCLASALLVFPLFSSFLTPDPSCPAPLSSTLLPRCSC